MGSRYLKKCSRSAQEMAGIHALQCVCLKLLSHMRFKCLKAGRMLGYIVDNLQLDLLLLNDEPVGVELPESVVMRVKETDPVVSADSYYKHAWMEGPARLDIGLEVLVPQFISPGDLIRVNTTNGEYMERV